MSQGGYADHVGRIDLTAGKVTYEAIPEEWKLKYIGARGVGVKYVFENGPKVDPLSPVIQREIGSFVEDVNGVRFALVLDKAVTVTSRKPDDLPAFCKAIIAALSAEAQLPSQGIPTLQCPLALSLVCRSAFHFLLEPGRSQP